MSLDSNGEMTVAWDPQLYLKFDRERTQPSIDLAARVEIAEPRKVIDLGCGPGNSTAVLQARWPTAEITGLDSDDEMLRAARRDYPQHYWLQQDAATWKSRGEYDVVFSNAMLQWLPNHAQAIENWFAAVAPGGALAVQVPAHLRSAVHNHILEVVSEPMWRERTSDAAHAINSAEAGYFYDILSGLSQRIDLWVTEYCHVLDGPEEIINWMRGTGLRPYLNVLSPGEQQRFEAELLERVAVSYPRQQDGKVLFPFRRLFFIAYQKS